MLDNLFGNLQQSQEEIQKKLALIEVKKDFQDGALSITMNGAKKILDISLNPEKVDLTDHEMLEDLMVEAMNQIIGEVSIKEQEVSQGFIKDMLQPGMGNLFGK